MIDTHAHLNYVPLAAEVEAVLARAQEVGVDRVVVPATNYDSSQSAIALATQYESVFACVGVHPADTFSPEATSGLEELLQVHPEIVAVGEVGLDYYRLPPEGVGEVKERQRVAFLQQIELAKRYEKPLIIHTRDAFTDAHTLLNKAARDQPVVIHCFTGILEEAQAWLDLGFHLSLTGILTYKNAGDLREVISHVPLERVMVETDSPYLAPQLHRGTTCEPAYVTEVVRCLAELYGRSVEEVAEQTTSTAEQFFKLP